LEDKFFKKKSVLSILIPVYNFEICQLVDDLHAQAVETSIDFEILCFDDGSSSHFKNINKQVGDLAQVTYHELPENLGRSKIRNELAKAARYEYLLFMDCDAKVVRRDYIQNYIQHFQPGTLLYGGRVYDPKPPADPSLRFHWHYGIHREQVDYKTRQQRPYHAFQTNNFLVSREVFLAIQFDESLKQYGHEDTLFGFELKNRKIPLLHIDNPLEHIGLEKVDVFLDKTQKGIINLLKIHKEYPFIETRLLTAYQFCKRIGLKFPLRWIYHFLKPFIKRKLRAEQPDLRWFDFYKLGKMFEN
jgi:glycosyltransferase involved in cell wall biosynthesis